MENKDHLKIKEILKEEYVSYVMKEREDMNEEAKRNILK